MNCEACREHLADVAEGGGPGDVRRHVESCGACQEQVRLFRETWRLMLVSPTGAPIDPVAAVEKDIRSLPELDQALFRDLTADDTTWELAENLDDMRAVDLAAPDNLGQEGYLIGEKKP